MWKSEAWQTSSARNGLVLFLSFVFIATCSVPGTIALRYLIQGILLLIAIRGVSSFKEIWQRQSCVIVALASYLFYALLHSLAWSRWPQISLGEFYGQLLMGGIWFLLGLTLFNRRHRISIVDLTIAGGVSLAFVEFLHGAYLYATTGHWPFMVTYTTETHLEFTFFMNLVLAFIAAALCFGSSQQRRITRFPRWALCLSIALIVFVSVKAGARNGMIGLVYLTLSMLGIYTVFEGLKQGWGKSLGVAALVIVAVGSLTAYSVHKDKRNQAFIESATEGWNYSAHPSWYNGGPLPLMSNGQPVDDSAFKRVAWIHSGLDLIVAHPIGYGFGRDAFSLALASNGLKNQLGHSHSGFIDLGVGLGIPGILLWFGFCGMMVLRGFRQFTQQHDARGLVLMLVTCGFIGRMMMESVNKDHMLILFLFLVGALLAEMRPQPMDAACD